MLKLKIITNFFLNPIRTRFARRASLRTWLNRRRSQSASLCNGSRRPGWHKSTKKPAFAGFSGPSQSRTVDPLIMSQVL